RVLPDRGVLYQPADALFVGRDRRAALALGAGRGPAPRAGADAGSFRARVAGPPWGWARRGRAGGLCQGRARHGRAQPALRAPLAAEQAAAQLDLLHAAFRARRAASSRQALGARVPLRPGTLARSLTWPASGT